MQEKNKISVTLNSSSTRDDVDLFYYLIKSICKSNNQDTFIREGEKCKVSQIDDVLLPEEQENNINSFNTTKLMIQKMGGAITIFGARNPIAIDEDLLNYLENDFSKYESFICDVQKMYEYYAAPFVLGDKKKNYGIYTFYPDVASVFPLKPSLDLADAPEDYKIDEWFVGNEEGLIKYNKFIKSFPDDTLYDAEHIVVEVSADEWNALIEKYGEDMEMLRDYN